MHPELILRALVLLAVANGSPVVVERLLGSNAAWPVDFHRVLSDGQRIFGPSKTIRGLSASIFAAACVAPLLGLSWSAGATVAAAAMAGDLFSSFIKRRLGMKPSSRATGLDQIPESLFGVLALRSALPLTPPDVAIAILAFFVAQVVASRLCYRINLRKVPY